MDKLRKSFKVRSEQSHFQIDKSPEEIQVLLNQKEDLMRQGDTENGNGIWRDSSYDFSKDAIAVTKEFEIGTASGSVSVSASPSLSKISESPTYGQLTPREVRVSFKKTTMEEEPVRRRSNASGHTVIGVEVEDDVVVTCTSNSSSSSQRKSAVLRTITKSRLIDPLEQQDRRSQNQRTPKSGMVGKGSDVDEDDPFQGEDLPDEYKKMRLSTISVLQLVSLIMIVAALSCTLAIPRFRNRRKFELHLWKWEVMILVLISGRLVSGCIIRLLVFFIERNFILRKRVLYFVYGIRTAVQNCIWMIMVLIVWQFIFDKKVENMTDRKFIPYVSKIWICLLVGTLIWLLKTLLVKVLASSFHVSTFFDRIQESLFNQYIIETLSGPPLIEIELEQEEEERTMAEVQKFQNAGASIPPDLKANIFSKNSPRFAKSPRFSTAGSDKNGNKNPITIDHLHRLNQKNISAWNMKRLMNIVRNGVLSTLHDQIQDSVCQDESAVEITNEFQAKAAARKIFYNIAKPSSKHIYLQDLMRFLREDEAMKMIHLIEGSNESKGISKGALKNWVVNIFRERRALALSLNDTKTAVNKLHQMLNIMVGVIVVVIWLLILRVATTHFFIFLSSQVLLVAFMFGNTCKMTFEAIIFLFIMHPFDVGDRCEVDGIQMIVEEMNILTTVFLRFDNLKIIYPNSILATKHIGNFYRSPEMGDTIDFCIHVATPFEKIASMKEKITRYVDNKGEHWKPTPRIVLRDVEDMNRLKISVWLTHRINFQDMRERWFRRALLVEEMIKVFRELDIEYRMLPMDVNVRNLPPLASNRLPSNWTTVSH
ncbi:mechanosensitive ion channel protein 6-like [Impatiens glandulifera]|uniref:mechanosensitive ion channel protein 6-like n=1 Tax=Impatiens glandulifera TaxID=253017 RepID=UPI001FB05084|nr:mechanosensitive ion channel protein 6-like [Impatiens glandulifera]